MSKNKQIIVTKLSTAREAEAGGSGQSGVPQVQLCSYF
jgi:hypothetical protein